MEEGFQTTYDSDWADAFTEVNDRSVQTNENFSTSHVVYKVKTVGAGKQKLKARLVPYGNRETEKNDIRKDPATAQLGIMRLLLSIVTIIGFDIATEDIKRAYLQSDQIKHTIYVRTPKEWH